MRNSTGNILKINYMLDACARGEQQKTCDEPLFIKGKSVDPDKSININF